VSRNLDSDFREEKNKLAPSGVINLYEIELDDITVVYFCDWDTDVSFGGKTYTAFPITRTDIEHDTSGKVTSIQVTLANVNRMIGGYLETYNGLVGRKIVIKMVFANLLNDPDAYVNEEFYVNTSFADERRVVLNASAKTDLLNIRVPRRRYYRNWGYFFCSSWICSC